MSTGSAASAWDALAREAARRREEGDEQVDLVQLLTFTLAGAPYAVPVERVQEIVRVRPATPIPRTPSFVLGVISLRGGIVQVIDLRPRLSLPSSEVTKASRIIVVHTSDDRVAGVLVDAVTEVLRVEESAIRPSASADVGAVEALCPRGEEFVSIVDLDRVLDIDAAH